MKKVMIYPCDKTTIPFVLRFNDFFKDCELNTVCSYEGCGIIGKDISLLDNRNQVGIIVERLTKEMLVENDILIIADNDNATVKKEAVEMMQEFKGKVICLMDLDNDEKMLLTEKNVNVKYYEELANKYDKKRDEIMANAKKLHKNESIILFVGGIVENANQTEVALNIAKEINDKGYKVSVIGKSKFYNVYPFTSYDSFLDLQNVDFIKTLNYHIEAVELIDRPDIIVVEVPGTLMRFDEMLLGDCGYNAYMFTQAVIPDYFVCCLPFGDYNDEFCKTISDDLENRFKFSADAIHISNNIINGMKSNESMKIETFSLPVTRQIDKINGFKNKNKFPVYNLLDSKEVEQFVDNMLAQF